MMCPTSPNLGQKSLPFPSKEDRGKLIMREESHAYEVGIDHSHDFLPPGILHPWDESPPWSPKLVKISLDISKLSS